MPKERELRGQKNALTVLTAAAGVSEQVSEPLLLLPVAPSLGSAALAEVTARGECEAESQQAGQDRRSTRA